MSNRVAATPPLFVKIAKQPQLFSAICKARMFYSRHFAVRPERKEYKSEKSLLGMSSFESERCQEMRRQGFTILHEFFGPERIDAIYEKVDQLFRDLVINVGTGYSVERKRRRSLEGLSYEELESSEKFISLQDPLLNVPECIDLVFHESILKIVANFLGYMPPRYRPLIVRDFPLDSPRESSNFHKDNNDCDTVQVFVYLVNIDDTRGPLIYVPGTHRYDVRSCRPKENRDLGIDGNDGRISDSTMEKYYPRETWATLKVKRGSVVIMHGNGFHKGPSWKSYDDPRNAARTAIRVDAHGNSAKTTYRGGGEKITRPDYERLTRLQRLFAKWSTVVD